MVLISSLKIISRFQIFHQATLCKRSPLFSERILHRLALCKATWKLLGIYLALSEFIEQIMIQLDDVTDSYGGEYAALAHSLQLS